ncbi:MAG: class I SAM-dependent methyltransferase [Kiritimatiellia bacterium]|nr:class I SAM-dependent methyltransferase [Kiritimatiellia bacterium]
MRQYEDPSLPRVERIKAVGYDYDSMKKQAQTRCNLCGADKWAVLAHHDRYGFATTTTACTRCGMTLLNPRMGTADYGRFYESVYRPLVSAYYGRCIDAVSIQAEQQAYSEELSGVTQEFLADREGASLLDVGGSTGVVSVHLAKEFGVKPIVLDPAPDEIREAEALGIETITSLVEDWDPGGKQYDIIGMFQTIDHLLDVASTLEKLRSVMADDGLLLIDIVDFRAGYLKNWSIESALKIDHPFSLTEKTAETYFTRAGFEPVKKVYSSDYHLILYVCRPCEPDPTALPLPESVETFFREVRFVQNAPRPGAGIA